MEKLNYSFNRHVGFHATTCARPPLFRFALLTCFALRRSTGPSRVSNSLLRLTSLCKIVCSSVRCAEHYLTRSARLCYDFTVRTEANGCSRIPSPLQGSGAPSRSLAELFISGCAEMDDLVSERTESKSPISRTSSASGREEGPAPQGVGSERPSSRSTQIAKQNRSAGVPVGQPEGLCYTRPSAEHTIWRSEVRRKGGRRGRAHEVAWNPTCLWKAI